MDELSSFVQRIYWGCPHQIDYNIFFLCKLISDHHRISRKDALHDVTNSSKCNIGFFALFVLVFGSDVCGSLIFLIKCFIRNDKKEAKVDDPNFVLNKHHSKRRARKLLMCVKQMILMILRPKRLSRKLFQPKKKRKSVSEDASVSKKSRTKAPHTDSNLENICESKLVDDEKLINIISKDKKKPVLKSLSKKKSQSPVDASTLRAPLFIEIKYYFKIDVKKRFVGNPQLYNSYNVIKDLNEKLLDGQNELFWKPLFGHFLDIQFIHLVLLRQIHTERDDVELWFKLGNKAIRFGIEEFSLITSLNCKKSYDVDLSNRKSYLVSRRRSFLCMELLKSVLEDDEDMVKIALVYFFSSYLYGYRKGKKIDNFIFAIVDGDDYIEVFNRH
ncbi:hypothetical protein G4B88_011698 [Cannabis sativa]|uniref:DUF1985 domain-containing protein n=1 Tax=Cannabis sativa TaxID=3483 RepID=A0A7J6FUR5_CANSA|nr:hypothetical protein G4B88_011698 [Cannabis sativa]